ncbi:hypothetical protein [Butyrivibrio sp. INlla14]|uniref:hypothetical protein n=1 Tax=Butyrivibrio sp. INlla14 TaxID=1520808 RepID=UPI000876BB10|nr:hypothetical protein [Butyrivibrio sp. INlla14]SCY25660.1 hypothetical protein SAMN02910371_01611 [Butyrivibrio sp. INlla14]
MEKLRSLKSSIISALVVLAVLVLTAYFGDYFFDLNDDVLMKDILSGAYTGTPEGHNIQMLYPISFFISVLYRTGINADWYGIFLCLLQYLCMFIIGKKVYEYGENARKGVLYIIAFASAVLGFFWPHLLYVQYTVVCGLLSATAAFLILSSSDNSKKDDIIAIIMILVAYLIRSEMLLLTLPMVGVAILIKWCLTRLRLADDKGISKCGLRKHLFGKYVRLCAFLILGLFACQMAHRIAYSNPEWKEFNRFFDNRTELYDFQYIPDYAENKDFYDSIGLSESEQKLLLNYNFELDDEINADTLKKIADYAASLRGEEKPLKDRLMNAVSLYIYRLHHVETPRAYEYPMTDYPWNMGVIALYIFVFIACIVIYKKDRAGLLQSIGLMVVLFACRSVLWLYIIMRGRDPIRITHPMYFLEMLILLGMLTLIVKDRQKKLWVPALCICLLGMVTVPMQIKVIEREHFERSLMLAHYETLYDYFKDNKDSYYFVDVYTSVSTGDNVVGDATFSEKMFYRVDNSFSNHDILGGWASKSPAYRDKLKKAGFENAQDALLSENAYFVIRDMDDVTWLSDYYREKGIEVNLNKVDLINQIFAIYKVERVE